MGLCASTRKPRQTLRKAVVTFSIPDTEDLVLTAPESSICCLLSPPLSEWISIQGEALNNVKLEKVCFKITSHDQGYCDIDIFSSEYDGTWTWFEAGIVRSFQDNEGTSTGADLDSHIRDAVANRENAETPLVTMVQKPGSESDIWHLQRNVRASGAYKLHEVVWEVQSNEEREEDALLYQTGRGRGDGFVESLKMQDRIAVIARRRYPGWINYIRKVEMELSYVA